MNGGQEANGMELFHRNMNFERIAPNAAPRTTGLSEREQVNLDEELISAAYHGDIKQVKELLETGASAEYQSVRGQTTALCMAASKNHTRIMQLLLNYGADINAMNINGFDAVYFAAVSFQPDALRLLLEKNSPLPKQYESYGHTVSLLMEILSIIQPHHGLEMNNDKVSVIRILLLAGFDVNGCVDKHSYQHSSDGRPDVVLSPLIQIVKSDFDCISFQFKFELCGMLRAFKVDINEQDPYGNTALHHAVLSNFYEMVQYLISAGGANVDILNCDGKKAQDLTNRNSDIDLVFGRWRV